ncbi:MAG: hypothetical protein JWM99_3674 [Verrucomicrobiales bacterium]|nr:hypothetical protein [Verrucomicrobiales bacterium]
MTEVCGCTRDKNAVGALPFERAGSERTAGPFARA